MSLLIIAGVAGSLIAILPASLLFLYLARFKGDMWLSAFLGGVFWLVAYLARTPLLLVIEFVVILIPLEWLLFYAALAIFLAALMAGFFEEGIKYLFLRRLPKFIKTAKFALCFGLGWGLGEALMIYVIDVLTIAFFYPILITLLPLPSEAILVINFLLGSLERNLAIIFHISATILVALAVWHGKPILAGLAILTHFLIDFIPIILLQIVLYPILGETIGLLIIGEGLIAFFAIFFALLVYFLWKTNDGLPPEKPETEFS